jgi:hypothetical protein
VTLGLGLTAAAFAVALAVSQRTRTPPPRPNAHVAPPVLDPFRSIAPDTIPVEWRPWNAATFAAARARGAPIAALVDVGWSESCVLYAAAVTADAAAHAALDELVAVRVDADRRPDVFERYCASSLPAWVFLSPSGRVIEVADAPAPAALARRLRALGGEPEPARADPGLAALRTQVPVPPPSSDLGTAARDVLAALGQEWPAGAALEPDAPFLDGDALDFLALMARRGDATARASYQDALGRVAARVDSLGAIDQEWFPAPGRIHRARFLATHATWLQHWQRAAAAGEAPGLTIAAATRTRAVLDSTFWDAERGLFRGAQGTLVLHAGRPALTSSERARMLASGHATMAAPHVPAVYPMTGNVRAAVALLETPIGAPDVAARRARGMRVLDAMRREWRAAGRVPRDFAASGAGRLAPGDCEWLGDVAELGRAILFAARLAPAGPARAALHRDAVDLATRLTSHFVDSSTGLFFDVPPAEPNAPERMQVRLAPLADSGRAALFLCELSAATSDGRWSSAARRAASGWTRAVRGHGAFAAAPFAAAAAQLEDLP